ncbi:MAG: WS/DGAT/MGAT family O-acyltransferase [Aeromicrobium sp.]
MDRLSGLDASFLYLETPEQLLHVCSLMLLDPSTIPGGYDFERLRDHLGERALGIPTFMRKLRPVPLGLDFPIWERDEHFDVQRHVHRMAIPAPGGESELADMVGHLAGLLLDRSRPLWEMWIIEGLASGQIAVFAKMHHATVDGVSGASLMSQLCSLQPDAEPLNLPATTEQPGRAPADVELFARGVVSTLSKPLQLANLVKPTVSILAGAASRARRNEAMAAPLTAPRTSFNGTITGHRSVAFADIELATIKKIKNLVPGATVNDVVLAISGGALRRYLEGRGELPKTSLLASVPVSVRSESSRDGGANKVSTLFTRLRTDLDDPLERLHALAEANALAKEHHKTIPADTLQDWAEFAAPRVFGLAVRAVSSLRLAERGPVIYNLVISNVPGPPMPLYFLGARVDAMYPLGPIFHGAGLNITVVSNNGMAHIGVIACRESVPEPSLIADGFSAELESLLAAVSSASGF